VTDTTETAPSTLSSLVETLLEQLGEDPKREGLLKTPDRVARSMRFLTQGYQDDLDEVVNGAIFHEPCDEMVVVKDIEFYSMCEHHLLPFYGRMHIAYIPDGRIMGLSKLPRITEMYARRLQVQERLTNQVAEAVSRVLKPKGVAVISEAAHLCMMMRGVAKQASTATTSCMLGAFREDPRTRSEMLSLVQQQSRVR
jgi:GTP cyclohydrolase I